jgi:O-methyltransferase involved in polyketide biosynthesis
VQIVLLSDGMDTRPYRLNWPRLSVIYDLSPERVHELGTKRLKGGILSTLRYRADRVRSQSFI